MVNSLSATWCGVPLRSPPNIYIQPDKLRTISFSPVQLPSLYMHKPIFTNGYLSLCLIQLILSFKAVLTECSRLRLKETIAEVFKTGNLQGYL